MDSLQEQHKNYAQLIKNKNCQNCKHQFTMSKPCFTCGLDDSTQRLYNNWEPES